jgi:hypothetical protein
MMEVTLAAELSTIAAAAYTALQLQQDSPGAQQEANHHALRGGVMMYLQPRLGDPPL